MSSRCSARIGGNSPKATGDGWSHVSARHAFLLWRPQESTDMESQTLLQGLHPGVPAVLGYIACGLEGLWEKGMQDLTKQFHESIIS